MRITEIPEFHDTGEILTLTPDRTAAEAARAMAARDVGCCLVTDAGGRLTGIFTERDLLTRVVAPGHDPARMRLCDAMTGTPRVERRDAEADDGLRMMAQTRLRRLPIVDEAGRLVGMVRRRDFSATSWTGALHRLAANTQASFMSRTQLWVLVWAFGFFLFASWLMLTMG